MKQILRHCYYLFALCFSKAVLLLPFRTAVRCGGVLGFLGYYAIGSTRKLTQKHLRRAFPEKTEGEINSLARTVFINQGKNAFELFSFPKLDKDALFSVVSVQNKEVFEQALAKGKGVLIASAHCGNWEIMGAALSQSGFPINVIARRIYIEGLNAMLVGFRTSKGVRVILRSGQESARGILRSIRHNESIGILIDQDTSVPGVFVDFFGHPAWTPSGLTTLALKTGAVVVLALDIRRPDDTHTVCISGPIEMTKSDDHEKDIIENTQRITKHIEDHVRAHPEQWVWMHERWKTQRQG